jgi:hypothetical protein
MALRKALRRCMWKCSLELLEAEDKVLAADYKGARVIVDALIAKYPLIDSREGSDSIC